MVLIVTGLLIVVGFFVGAALAMALVELFGFILILRDRRAPRDRRIVQEIESDYLATRKAMNDTAGKSYRNLVL